MAVTLEAWTSALQALLPPGRAFTREPGSVLSKVLGAIAAMFLAAQLKFEDLIDQADPRVATTLLPDWERLLGLPDNCVVALTQVLIPGLYGYEASGLTSFLRASTATYVGSDGLMKTAAVNAPRFDYHPVTHALRGLLVEAAATNLASYSEQLDNAAWLKSGMTVTPNAVMAPDGTMTADRVDAAAGAIYSQSFAKSASIQTYTWSLFVSGTVPAFTVTIDDGVSTGNRGRADFNLVTGTLTSVVSSGTFTGASAKIEAGYNGMYRASITVTTDAGLIVRPRNFFTGNGVIYVNLWGAQFEVGAAATSYIPTAAAIATRQADVATVLVPQSTFERQRAAHQRLVEQGGQSAAYFIGLAALLGQPGCTVTEFRPMNCNDDCNDALYSPEDRFNWQFNIPAPSVGARAMNCNDDCNDPLDFYTPSLVECPIRERKPAHTKVFFSYTA